jgi:hypothetical protein
MNYLNSTLNLNTKLNLFDLKTKKQKQNVGPSVFSECSPTAAAVAVRLSGGTQSRRTLRSWTGHFAHAVGGRHIRRCKCGNIKKK